MVEPYLGLEQAASVIRSYDVQFIPGLLQTPDYARAVARLATASPRPAPTSWSSCGCAASRCCTGRIRRTCGW